MQLAGSYSTAMQVSETVVFVLFSGCPSQHAAHGSGCCLAVGITLHATYTSRLDRDLHADRSIGPLWRLKFRVCPDAELQRMTTTITTHSNARLGFPMSPPTARANAYDARTRPGSAPYICMLDQEPRSSLILLLLHSIQGIQAPPVC